jgi:23S rRNA pseudouridine2605 synthase
MFDLIGHSVIKLRRSQIGPLRDDKLKPGAWRKLSEEEVKAITTKSKSGRPARVASHASSRQ